MISEKLYLIGEEECWNSHVLKTIPCTDVMMNTVHTDSLSLYNISKYSFY